MKDKVDIYNSALDAIREQVNRITYSNNLSPSERLKLLDKLEKDIKYKLDWARNTFAHSPTGEKKRDLIVQQ